MEARHACCMLWQRATLLNPLDGGHADPGLARLQSGAQPQAVIVMLHRECKVALMAHLLTSGDISWPRRLALELGALI